MEYWMSARDRVSSLLSTSTCSWSCSLHCSTPSCGETFHESSKRSSIVTLMAFSHSFQVCICVIMLLLWCTLHRVTFIIYVHVRIRMHTQLMEVCIHFTVQLLLQLQLYSYTVCLCMSVHLSLVPWKAVVSSGENSVGGHHDVRSISKVVYVECFICANYYYARIFMDTYIVTHQQHVCHVHK